VEQIVVTMRVIVLLAITSCGYDASFEDCTISCSAATGCPDGLACGSEGLCRTSGTSTTCAAILGDAGTDAPIATFPSCVGLAATCGADAQQDCCTSPTVSGGTYFRSYDVGADGMYPGTTHPATVSDFRLDAYEVTVGRFRAFVSAGMGTQIIPPDAGTGAHPQITGSGWDASWDGSLTASRTDLAAALRCSARASWTDAPTTNEALPINCITWFEANAFCAWDGGFLPTEAEWNYAATGGAEQRAYPWSSPPGMLTIDCAHANYQPGAYCTSAPTGSVDRVGSESPAGDGKYGQADLAGNVSEWTLDWYQSAYVDPCADCADLTPSTSRVFRGGGFYEGASSLRTAFRNVVAPTGRYDTLGVRCARPL
jgi:formylglycine-generating enzyme